MLAAVVYCKGIIATVSVRMHVTKVDTSNRVIKTLQKSVGIWELRGFK
jgi:hypothetical protein